MNERLLKHGAAILVVAGVLLAACGIALDRDWLAGMGVVLFALGVVLPRIEGPLEVGPSGFKAVLVSREKIADIIRGKGLPPEATAQALERAEHLESVLIETSPVTRDATFTADAIIVEVGTAVEENVANQIIAATGYGNNVSEGYGSVGVASPEDRGALPD